MPNSNHIIWSNLNLNLDEWRTDLADEHPDATEDELYDLMNEYNADYLDDERMNLNITLSAPIIVIGDLGFWHGRRMGYKEIESGNIADCLSDSDCDYLEWYVDRYGNFRCIGEHHDGENRYLYRAYKDDTTDSQRDLLKEKIYNGTVTKRDITRYTRSLGAEIRKVYGW